MKGNHSSLNHSQSYFTTGGLPPISSSWRRPLRLTASIFIFKLNVCGCSPYVTSSLTRGWVYRLQLLLVLASAVIHRSETCGIHYHILLSEIRDSPNLEGQIPILISPRERCGPVMPPGTGFPFRRLLRLAVLRWRYSTPPPHRFSCEVV
jgi:hypothetical protein